LNAAVCAWSSTHERICIENRLSEWQPDMVISLTGANDAHWGFGGSNILDFRTYEDDIYFELINQSLSRAGTRPYAPIPPLMQFPHAPQDLVGRLFVKNVRLAAVALAQAGARYVVALQPFCSPRDKPLTPDEQIWLKRMEAPGRLQYTEDCFEIMRKLIAKSSPDKATAMLNRNPPNMDVIDLEKVFSTRQDPIYLDIYHVGDKGNELIARRLVMELETLETRRSKPVQ
jgi:hypothetical protein